MKSYDYARRKGVEEISWERFAEMCDALAEEISSFKADLILGIARAGLFPATAISLALRREQYPIRLTRRVNDIVSFDRPVWRLDVPAIVQGQRVAILDEIADTGETLALVATRTLERGASQIKTAALAAHSWADPQPNISALVSDALIIFPWDRRVLIDGQWRVHPEIEEALRSQKYPPGEDLPSG